MEKVKNSVYFGWLREGKASASGANGGRSEKSSQQLKLGIREINLRAELFCYLKSGITKLLFDFCSC